MIASGSDRLRVSAAAKIAGAVLRASGSIRMGLALNRPLLVVRSLQNENPLRLPLEEDETLRLRASAPRR
jgi:hypothetical protein